MSSDDIRLDIQANITPVFQKPLAADPNQTKFSAQLELRPAFQKWLNTDLRFKDPLSADIHFTDQSLRAAQTRLQNTVLQSLKDIQIQLRGPSTPAALLKDINDLFKNTPIKLLDSDTKIDKQAITAYIRRYIAELETAIKQAPPTIQAKLELDVQHLREELRTVQATINVGIEPDTTKLRESFNQVTATLSDGFAASVDSLVQSFAEKISSELGKPIPIKLDSDKILIDLKNTLAQFQQSAPNVLNATLQAGSSAVSQAQSGSPQSPDVFTAQLLSLSEELEAAKDLLTDPLVDLAQTIQTQVGQLTSLPDYSQIFDTLTGHVEAAGQEFTHLHQTISSFRALIENTQQQTASPSEAATEARNNTGATTVPELTGEFTSAPIAPVENQQTSSTSEETRSIAENVQRLTEEATNGNSLDTHDHTAETLLKTAIATLNAIHSHLVTNLDVQLSTINAGGGNASLANPNLFAARNSGDYVDGWTETKNGTTRLADELESGYFSNGPRAVDTQALSGTLGVNAHQTSMAVSAGVQENKALNLSVVETALSSLSTMTGDFTADMDALIASTSNAVQRGTLEAFKNNIEFAAVSSGIASSNLMDYAHAVLNADAQIKAQSDRQDEIADLITLFDDTNSILTEAQDKMRAYQEAGIAVPETLLTTYKDTLQQQKAMSATYGAELHRLFQEFQDKAKTSKALKETALANATANAAPGTSPTDIQIAANQEYERLQNAWIAQMEGLVAAIKTGASTTITSADRFGRHDNTVQEIVTVAASGITPTDLRDAALATSREVDQSARAGNWDAMIEQTAKLQEMFGQFSNAISGLGSALSGLIDGLPAEFGQTVGQLQGEIQHAHNNYKQITQAGQNLSKAGSKLAEMGAQAGGRIGNAANLIGRGMQTAGSLLARAAIPLTAALSALQVIHGAFKEMQGLWLAQSQAAEATRQLTADQGTDRRLRTQTDLTALAQARAQSAENVADQSRTHAEQSAQNALSGTSGVAQAQERLIRLETERLKLAEQNALISKQTEQQRANAEKELQNSQAQRQQQSQLTFKDGFWTGNQLIDGSGQITADKDELGLRGTGIGRQVGVSAGAIGGGIAGGLAAGALAGAVAGSVVPIVGNAVGLLVGGIIGAAGAAAGSFVGRHAGMALGGAYDNANRATETDAQRQSRLNQEDILAHADSAWTSIGDESLKQNIQAAVDDYNKETSALETEKFKQLDAELDAITAGVHAFGDVLPTEQLKQFQEASQQAVNANLQYAQTQAALDQFDRTSKMSDEQLKTESGRERKGWFWNTTSYERVLGVDAFGKQVIATGNTFEEFQKDLEEKTKQLAPVLEARNAAAKQEAEQRRQTAMLEGHNAEILGKAAIATRAAIDAFNNALVELAKHFDDFLLNSAKQLTADARNVRYSPDSLSSTINQQRESDAVARRENTFKAQQTAIAGLGGDYAFELSRRQEEVRYKDALRNRQLADMSSLSDTKRQQSFDIFQLEQTHKVARHQLELDQAPSEAEGKKANDRGAQLRDEKNALDRKHLAERQDLEKKIAEDRNKLAIETQKRQMAFEMNLVKLQHEERMKGIQEEYKRREAFEKELLAAQAAITENPENKERIQQARERGGTEYHGKSDFEVWVSENAKNSARLQQDILRLREYMGSGDPTKLATFNKKIAEAGGNEFKIAEIVGQFAKDTGYDPGKATASDDKAVEDARTADKLAAGRVASLKGELDALKEVDDPDGMKRVQLQASLDLALQDKAKSAFALEDAERARTDNIAQQQLDFAHRVDPEAYKKKEEADQQYAKTIADLIAKTEAKEISDDEYKKILEAADQVANRSAEHEQLKLSLNDETPAAERAKAEARMAEIKQEIERIGKQTEQSLKDNATAKETAARAINVAVEEGAMLGNRQHQAAEGTKQEMEQNKLNAHQNKERNDKEKEIQDEEEKRLAQEEAERRTLKHIREQKVKDRKDNREVLDDQLKGDMNRISSSGRLESERNRTQLATAMLGSKSGIDRMRAMGDYRANEQYNQQSTALQRRQKLEMEALLDRGGNESERMALEDKHNEERAQLDNSKSIADALRSSLGNVGSLRGLVSESTGGTSSLQDAWKRQEQAAFGHIKDPVADAVTMMDRSAQVFHANLMGYLVEKLPGLLSGQQGSQMSMVQQYFSEEGGLV